MKKFFDILWKIIRFPFLVILRIILLPYNGIKKLNAFMNYEPEDHPISETLANTLREPMSMLDHIQALRKHLLRMVLSMVLAIIAVSFFTPQVIDWLSSSIGGIQNLKAIDVTESISVFMRVALTAGFALASPYVAFELWLFAAPGLKPRGRKIGLIGIPLATILLLAGMAFAYYVMLPTAVPFLLNFLGIQTIPRPSSYINFVTGLMFWIGVAFEFPLVVFVLTLMGVLKPTFLVKHWRIAVILIAVAAAVITPTVDPVNMSLVMAPMVLLYFIGIGLSYLAISGKKKQRQKEL
jgi:sec-independent protein translocase protein TatC